MEEGSERNNEKEESKEETITTQEVTQPNSLTCYTVQPNNKWVDDYKSQYHDISHNDLWFLKWQHSRLTHVCVGVLTAGFLQFLPLSWVSGSTQTKLMYLMAGVTFIRLFGMTEADYFSQMYYKGLSNICDRHIEQNRFNSSVVMVETN